MTDLAQHGEPSRYHSNVEIFRAVAQASWEGRLGDMLALIHPDIVCYPLTRPGLTRYEGHSGFLRLIKDSRRARGDYRLEYDEITERPDGRVLARGRLMRSTDAGDVVAERMDVVVTFRDGLVIGLESQPVSAL
jgi:ketosteroid isomerase-like protein